MATETTTSRETTETKPVRGFLNIPCLRCQGTGGVNVSIDDVSQFNCSSCDQAWTADEVRDMLTRWGDLLAWLSTAPVAAD